MSGIVRLNNISYSLTVKKILSRRVNVKNILRNISFDIEESKILGIAGESGSGKTSLAKIIAGIIKPTRGNIVKNLEVESFNRSINPIQILFQNSAELINPLRRIEKVIRESAKSDTVIKEIFRLVNLPADILTRRGYQLSGGERQRVALGRLLTVEPKILILDEPFSAQDFDSQLNFVNLLKKLTQEKEITIVCVSHNVNLLKNFADEIIILYGGQIMEMGEANVLVENHLHPYTKFLLSAENYKLSTEDFVLAGNQIKYEKPACPYIRRCPNPIEECNDFIKQISENELITFCNNPLIIKKSGPKEPDPGESS